MKNRKFTSFVSFERFFCEIHQEMRKDKNQLQKIVLLQHKMIGIKDGVGEVEETTIPPSHVLRTIKCFLCVHRVSSFN